MKTSTFMLGTVALMLLSVSGWASDKMKANIQIYEAVHVGAAQLAPGEYNMTWTGTGTNTEVTFSQGKNVIATAPAQITHVRSGYDGPVLHTDTVANTLTAVALPKTSFSFSSDNAVTGN